MSNQDPVSYLMRAVKVAMASLGMEHPHTQQIRMNYLTLLAQVHTNGDLDALLRLLSQGEQDGNTDGGAMQG